ncbi:penicillin acylase family protein [Rubrivirga sp.]|uniref:penicillin acylase family protein n=1 Tax=Rubrivirga sp. TaxID=1885344 RepID=UPI003B51ADF9
MARVLLTLGVVLVLVVGLAAAVGVLAYGTEPPREGTLEIAGLAEPVTLAWDDSGRVWVEGPDEVALAAGLGYAHAADHGWAVSLWRQAARGTLAEWFGGDARDLDLHARTLGFAALGRRTYEALPAADRAVLDAYARGASAALAQPGVAQGDAFILADVVPQPWAPWDALAVERLHAYLAAPAPSADSTWRRAARADSAVARFLTADSSFRAFLGMPGGGYDRAYVVSDGGAGRRLVQQVSAGSSALALLAPAVLRTPGQAAVALTIPGTLVSPGGWTNGFGWGLLLGSDLRLERYDGPAPPPLYSRVVERDGDETLLAVALDTTGLVLRAGRDRPASDTTAAPTPSPSATSPSSATPAGDATAEADTTTAPGVGSGWRVRWRGFRLGTDLGAFRALRAGRVPPRFVLFDGAGLAATRADTRVMGTPRVAMSDGVATLVAQDSLARRAAALLTSTARADSSVADTSRPVARPVGPADREVASAWARRQLPGLLAGLGARDSLADVLQGPYSYLNGWDGAYRADGIAPSLFEWWLVAHRDFTGHLPDPADSLDVALLPSTLRIARAELRDRYGPRPTDWRWGRLQGGPRYPVLGERRGAAARRFRDALGAPGGHPTSLLPGPSVVFEGAQPGLAAWTVRTDLRTGRVAVLSPARRELTPDIVDMGTGPDGSPLVLDPSAPLPAERLRLLPIVS